MMDDDGVGRVSVWIGGRYAEITADESSFLDEVEKLEDKGYVPIWETFKKYPDELGYRPPVRMCYVILKRG
ncbi:MAG: hypothetical protein B6U72_02980 [Candidatus Altiarchaeales archaeon ex4484_2]|nr:MAG: hypothetical protein B6U72_02980 [Candidatus Altiarchaeales archaeon ex4484_2]